MNILNTRRLIFLCVVALLYSLVAGTTAYGAEQAFLEVEKCSTTKSDQEISPTIIGNDEIIVSTNETLDDITDDVYACNMHHEDVTNELDIYSNVDFRKEGKYEIIYRFQDLTFIQTVFVKDDYIEGNLPVFIGLPEVMMFEVSNNSGSILLKDLYAYDSLDGDLTDDIVVDNNEINFDKEGKYTIPFSITNSEGSSHTETVTVFVLSKSHPFISTTVSNFKAIVGKEPNYTAWLERVVAYDYHAPNYDLTEQIVIDDQKVDYSRKGKYEIKFSVTNKKNQVSSIVCHVYILDENEPMILNADDITVHVGSAGYDWLANVEIEDYKTESLDIDVVDQQVNIHKVGTYPLYYIIKDENQNKILKKVTVQVHDLKGPKIKLNHDFHFEVSTRVPEFKHFIYAFDREEGDVSNTGLFIDSSHIDFNHIGTYPLYVKASDSSGNITEEVFDVVVVSKRAPVLIGTSNKTITVGETYDPLKGIKAIDLHDGDITDQIKVDGYYDSDKEGTYAITYIVKDSSGNVKTDTIVITVEQSPLKLISFYIVIAGVVFLVFSAIIMISRKESE